MVSVIDKEIHFNNTFVGAVPLPRYYYNSYYHPTYIYKLDCIGVENNILDCPYDNSYRYCSYYKDAAVVCQCKYSYNIR